MRKNKKNHILKKKIEINEQEKLDLEQQLETGIKPTRKKGGKGIRNANLESHQKMLEEKNCEKKERKWEDKCLEESIFLAEVN